MKLMIIDILILTNKHSEYALGWNQKNHWFQWLFFVLLWKRREWTHTMRRHSHETQSQSSIFRRFHITSQNKHGSTPLNSYIYICHDFCIIQHLSSTHTDTGFKRKPREWEPDHPKSSSKSPVQPHCFHKTSTFPSPLNRPRQVHVTIEWSTIF